MQHPTTNNIKQISKKARTNYRIFVRRLHDRGLTVGQWAKNNRFDRTYVWRFFNGKFGHKRGGVVTSRLIKILKEQGLINHAQ